MLDRETVSQQESYLLEVILWLLAEAGPEKFLYLPVQASLHYTPDHSTCNWLFTWTQILFLCSHRGIWVANMYWVPAVNSRHWSKIRRGKMGPVFPYCLPSPTLLPQTEILIHSCLGAWRTPTWLWGSTAETLYGILQTTLITTSSAQAILKHFFHSMLGLCFPSCSPLSRRSLKRGLDSEDLLTVPSVPTQERLGMQVFSLLSFPWKCLCVHGACQINPVLNSAPS